MLVSLSLHAHSRDQVSPGLLVGKWVSSGTNSRGLDVTISVEFEKDLRFQWRGVVDGEEEVQSSGTWSVSGDFLRWRYEQTSSATIPVGFIDNDQIVEINENSMTLRSLNGVIGKYRRIH
jgi:hypothetical protein